MRYTVWPDIDHITEETWPTQGLYGTFVGKLDAALGTFGEESKPVATPKPVTAATAAMWMRSDGVDHVLVTRSAVRSEHSGSVNHCGSPVTLA